ncbi:MAG TPA: L,D-transpeptidase, partial [Solirubrobacteraceae bacterium]|nr:L,D-transpeptidase [Solirubrobacteraceae bacterium]
TACASAQAGIIHRLSAVLAVCLLGVTAGPAFGAGTPARVKATQQLAVLESPHGAHQEPEASSPQTEVVPSRRPITGERTTLPVTGSLTGADGVRWLQVMLPGRPNSSTGWIAQQGTRKLMTGWHIVVDLAARRVSAYSNGHLLRSFQAVVGKPSTPTPTGQFFVEEIVQMASGEAGGPFALALSARSDALQEFEGGPGQIAIHGRDNLGGTLGAAESHGCIRLGSAGIDWLAARIGPGTPATIYG